MSESETKGTLRGDLELFLGDLSDLKVEFGTVEDDGIQTAHIKFDSEDTTDETITELQWSLRIDVEGVLESQELPFDYVETEVADSDQDDLLKLTIEAGEVCPWTSHKTPVLYREFWLADGTTELSPAQKQTLVDECQSVLKQWEDSDRTAKAEIDGILSDVIFGMNSFEVKVDTASDRTEFILKYGLQYPGSAWDFANDLADNLIEYGQKLKAKVQS